MDDFISRAAALNGICKVCNKHHPTDKDLCPDKFQGCLEYYTLFELPAADVRPVVCCRDCVHWTKQEASLQGRCELLGIYPTGAWFCANAKREDQP